MAYIVIANSFPSINATPINTDSFMFSFNGAITIFSKNSFGFVDDTYISEELIKEHKIKDGRCISGKAIYELNPRKKSGYSLQAITIDHEYKLRRIRV
jgi:hypothetical protein